MGLEKRIAIYTIPLCLAAYVLVEAASAYWKLPYIRDLFHVVYPRSLKRPPEDTFVFLLMPAIATFFTTVALIVKVELGVRRQLPLHGGHIFVGCVVWAAFCATAMVRLAAVQSLQSFPGSG